MAEYIVFLGRNENDEVIPLRIVTKPDKLKPNKGEFAAFVVEAQNKPQAAWKAAQIHHSQMAIALSELWIMNTVSSSQQWDWDKRGHDSILSGVQQAKEEFAEHLDLSRDEIVLPKRK